MADMMTFPDTVEEFMEQYKVVDTDGVYMSKGSELIPIFRMRQWFEHLPSAQPKHEQSVHSERGKTDKFGVKTSETCEDCISRQAAIEAMANTLWHYPNECYRNLNVYEFARGLAELGLKSVPSAPERKTGEWYKPVGMMPPEYTGVYRCSKCDEVAMRDWKHHKQVLSNFCPNCGADMREGQDDSI